MAPSGDPILEELGCPAHTDRSLWLGSWLDDVALGGE